MPVSQTFRLWVAEQLRPNVRQLRDRSMFGGVGIYAGELFFALLAEDRLYLKVDDTNRADFVAAGMSPFCPFGDERMVMQYYEVPLEVIERPAELSAWAAKSIEVARAAKKSKPKKKTAKSKVATKKVAKRAPQKRKKS
ncbi:TfoX/Sxy family protein [Anatilimnocola floriformis]|uniref:TfoX/Sxy family protein n=1 Tax=Anatilimnocola floriformis TaxID=2948575 RepID=UPI0020C4BD76|nr:TfoX/Sxy family protein [Anatilimnocola floriformis]